MNAFKAEIVFILFPRLNVRGNKCYRKTQRGLRKASSTSIKDLLTSTIDPAKRVHI